MTGQPTIATVTTRLRHVVRVLHASTRAPIRGLATRLDPAAYGWSVRVLPDAVVVAARTDVAEPPAAPKLVVTLKDGALADLLELPASPGMPPRSVVVDLTAPETEVELHPIPTTLTVVLTRPSDGTPRAGATVVARATSGPNPKPTISLPETDPGTYSSAAVEWTAAFTPLDLLVGGDPLRTLAMDFTKARTTIHLVDTT
jgi:hypothetical protein